MSRARCWSTPLALLLSVVCLGGCKKPSEAEPGATAPATTEKVADAAAKPAPIGLSKSESKPASAPEADDDTEPGERREATAERSAGDEKPGRRRSSSRKADRSVRAESAGTTRDRQADEDEDEGDDKGEDKAPADVPLVVKRIQFSETIAGREPVSPEETFGAGDTKSLYAFVELQNPTAQASKIVVTFVPPQGASTKVTLKVGEVSRWRTWALRKKPTAVGTWNVVVSSVDGKELARRSFEVTE